MAKVTISNITLGDLIKKTDRANVKELAQSLQKLKASVVVEKEPKDDAS